MSDFSIIDKIMDSRDFTAGGGSASAIAGAMAAGMVAMVARLSLNKEYGLTNEEYEEAATAGDELSKQLLSGATEDNEAFMLIKKAYSLPKATEEEKANRSNAIQAAAIKAATVPMENAEKCKKVQGLCLMLQGRSNPNASSDLEGAMLLSHAGMLGCTLNVDANLPLIKDEEARAQFVHRKNEIIK